MLKYHQPTRLLPHQRIVQKTALEVEWGFWLIQVFIFGCTEV
jgi:hypothetical protein